MAMYFCFQLPRRFRISTGTGLAHPSTGRLVISAISGNTTVPIGSMCTAGLSETRPRLRAVGSPSRYADHAWAASCTVSEISRIRKTMKTWTKSMSGKGLRLSQGLAGGRNLAREQGG
jgi:hypothetical protein